MRQTEHAHIISRAAAHRIVLLQSETHFSHRCVMLSIWSVHRKICVITGANLRTHMSWQCAIAYISRHPKKPSNSNVAFWKLTQQILRVNRVPSGTIPIPRSFSPCSRLRKWPPAHELPNLITGRPFYEPIYRGSAGHAGP